MKTPWVVVFDAGKYYIEDAEENVILDGPYLDVANDAVHAVNSYEAQQECIKHLIAALQRMADASYLAVVRPGDDEVLTARLHSRATIAHAKELLNA